MHPKINPTPNSTQEHIEEPPQDILGHILDETLDRQAQYTTDQLHTLVTTIIKEIEPTAQYGTNEYTAYAAIIIGIIWTINDKRSICSICSISKCSREEVGNIVDNLRRNKLLPYPPGGDRRRAEKGLKLLERARDHIIPQDENQMEGAAITLALYASVALGKMRISWRETDPTFSLTDAGERMVDNMPQRAS